MLIAFALGGMFLSSLLSGPIVMLMTGEPVSSVSRILLDPGHQREMQVVQVVSSVMMLLLPTLFTAGRLSRRPMELTGFRKTVSTRQIGLVVLITIFGMILSGSLGYLSYQLPFPESWQRSFQEFENTYLKQAVQMIKVDSMGALLVSLLVIALIPAVCEETFFRGGLQNYLYRSNGKIWLSVVVVSLVFSAIHFSAYGFLSRFALGMMLGLIFQFTGSLWLSILFHGINNGAAVLMIYFQRASGKTLEAIIADRDGSYWGLLALPLVVYFFILLKKDCKINTTETDGI